MTTTKKHTITFPDGTKAVRTSKTRSYVAVSVLAKTREHAVAEAQREYDNAERVVTKHAETLHFLTQTDEPLREDGRSWVYGGTYVNLYAGEHWVGAAIVGGEHPKAAPTREALADEQRRLLVKAIERRDVYYADRLVAAKNSPAVTYAALGWSVSVKGAESAARGFAKYHEQHGSRVTVEMVDGLA